MESIFQRFGWAINFALIAVATLLLAMLINSFVAIQLAELTVPSVPTFDDVVSDEGPVVDDDRDHWVDGLTSRCLFGCPEEEIDPDECPEDCPEGEICEAGECVPDELDQEEEIDDGVPRLTELDVKLSGVMAASNPRWSIAMILDNEAQETYVVGVGDALPVEDPVEVLEIRRDRVFIENDGRLEFIRLEDSPYGDPEGQQGQEGRRSERSEDGATEDDVEDRRRQRRAAIEEEEERRDESGIEQRGDGEYAVDRSRIEEELENADELSRQARVMPNYREGRAQGLRLVGVTSDSIYSDIGIRSGDVLRTVNGENVSSQEQAMDMFERMRNDDDVTIEIDRRGERQEKSYSIR